MDSGFLAGVVGIVEATSYERMCLWKEAQGERVWVENTSGYMPTIGAIDGRSVCLSLITAIIDDHKILFVDPCSYLVDHVMIEKWLKANVSSAIKENGYLNKHDAMNFHNVFPQG